MTHPARERRRAVVALGGNALLRRGEPLEAANQARAARDAARVLARASLACAIGSGSERPKLDASCAAGA